MFEHRISTYNLLWKIIPPLALIIVFLKEKWIITQEASFTLLYINGYMSHIHQKNFKMVPKARKNIRDKIVKKKKRFCYDIDIEIIRQGIWKDCDILRTLPEKVESVQVQMGNVSREIETQTIKGKC